MKNKYVLRTIKILSFALAAFLIMTVTQVRCDHNKIRLDGFYMEEKNSLDVVLLGASEVYTAFSSALAYDEFGFTSYPYAIESNFLDLFSSQIKEILNNQKPKLLIIETNGALYPQEYKENEANIRRYTDGMPLSQNKIDTINEFGDKDEKISYYFPWIMYHGSLSNFRSFKDSLQQQVRGYSMLKGVTTCTLDEEAKDFIDVCNDKSKLELNPDAESRLIELLNFCRAIKYTKIVFTRFPHRITDGTYDRFKLGNTLKDIVESYGFDFLDFEPQGREIGIDYVGDYYNNDHMNIYGQQKFTKFLGKTLVEKYNLFPSELSPKNKEKWELSVQYTNLYIDYVEFLKDTNKNNEIWLTETYDLMRELDKLKASKH